MKAEWSSHPDTIETYIGVVSSIDHDRAVKYIRELLNEPANASQRFFNVALAGHARSIVQGWAK